MWEPDFGAALGFTDDDVDDSTFGTFSFPFAATTYTGADILSISSNGFISLGGSNGHGCCSGNPTDLTGDAFARIAPFWTDLDPETFGDVYLNTFPDDDADPEIDRVVVTWDTVTLWSGSPVSVQVQLLEDGNISMGFNKYGFTADDDNDVLIGISPGGGVTDPASIDYTTDAPFDSVAEPTIYEWFEYTPPPPVDIAQDSNIFFHPNGSGGFNISISLENNPPVGSDDFGTVAEGGTVSVLVGGFSSVLDNDTDPELPFDILTVNTSPVSGPNHGALTLAVDGTFTYTHDGTENFSDSFVYEVIDADEATDTATVTLEIIPNANIDFSAASVDLTVAPGEAFSSFLTIGNIGGDFLDWQIEPVLANIIFFEDFESGSIGWTTALVEDGIDDLWHQTTIDSYSPNTSWWAADPATGDYETGNHIQNALISPPIDLTSITGVITLSFFEDYYTEQGWDYVMVDASIDDGQTWTQLRGFADINNTGTAPSGDSNGWIFTSLDLTPFAGQVIRVRFFLDSLDNVFNDFPGWKVDDVTVNSGTNLPSWLTRIAPAKQSQESQFFDSVEFAFSAADLSLGFYTGVVNVFSNDIDEALTALPVNLTVADVPDINVSPLFFALGLGIDQSTNISTTIENLGTDTLNYTITSSQTWLLPAPDSGSIAAGADAIDISVDIDATGLTTGLYFGFLTISSDDPNETEIFVDVDLTVGPPDISAPSSIFPEVVSGGTTFDFLFIDNNGGEPLDYAIASDSFWLTTDPVSGSISSLDFDFVDVIIDASALAPGDYVGMLTRIFRKKSIVDMLNC